MKKLLILMMSLISFSLVYFSFKDVNENQATNVYLLNNVIEQNLHMDEYFVDIQFNEPYKFQDICKAVAKYVYENKLTCIVTNTYKDSEGIYNMNDYYILSSDSHVLSNYLIEGDTVDFSHLTEKKYYSTQVDENASGMIKILNNDYFNLSQDIFRFKQFNRINEINDKVLQSIYLSIYAKDNQFIAELEETLNEQFNDIQVNDISSANEHIYNITDQQFINKNKIHFFEIIIIIFIILLTVSAMKNTKKYMIRRMMGTSVIKIAVKEYFTLLFICQLCFSTVLTLTFNYLCPESNMLTKQFYNQIFPFHFYCLGTLMIMFLIIYVFIYFTSHVKYLHTQNHYKHLYHIQVVMKVIVVVILMPTLIGSFKSIYPYVINYLTINSVKDDINNLYYLNSIPEKSQEIFNYYIDKTDYVDFNDYYSNSSLFPQNTDNEEYLMKYPYIHVNAHYLKQYDIRDTNNNIIDFSQYNENVLLVPIEYKGKDLSNYYPSKKDKIVYIQNNGKFVNLRIEEPFVVRNPIIYLEKEYDIIETKMRGFCFKTDQFSKLNQELKEIEGTDVMIVSSTYKYNYYIYMFKQSIIELFINISVYLVVYLTLIMQSMLLYLGEKGKEISIGYTLGITKWKRYLELLIFNIGSYIAIFVGSMSLNVTLTDRIKFIILFVMIELIIEVVYVYRFEKTSIISCLKGEKVE